MRGWWKGAVMGLVGLAGGCSPQAMKRQILLEPPASQPMLQPPPRVSVPVARSAAVPAHNNSLWQQGARTFLRDQRSSRVGDTVLVVVSLQDEKAKLVCKSTINPPDLAVSQQIPALAGFENQITKLLPKGANPASLVSLTRKKKHQADTKADRKETVQLRVAATLVRQMPQGNFVVYGHQQLVVNHERRDVYVAGILDPRHVLQDNTVSHRDLAEARIVYGGVGTLSDAQEKRAMDRWLSTLIPF
jgi:flagellar L-ring protein precursor FlgH